MAVSFKFFNPSTGAYETGTSNLHEENMQIKVDGLTGTSVLTVALSYDAGDDWSELVSRKFYPGLSGELYLDLREDVSSLLSLGNVNTADGAESAAWAHLKIEVGSSSQTFYVYVGSAAVTNTGVLTDIDYLDVDYGTQLRLAIVNQALADLTSSDEEDDTVTLDVMTQRGLHSLGNYEFTGDTTQRLLHGRKNVSALGVRYDEPFRLVYGAVSGTSYTPVKTPIFCLRRGSAEKFLFLNKYGAWDIIPMFGALKRTPEYTLESVATASGRVQTRAEKEEIFSQDSGYLTENTFLALGEDFLSRQIYHFSGSSWRRITIEETDFSFSGKDDLHSCTFKFRYCDSYYIPSV